VNAEFRRAEIPAELRSLQAFDRKVFRKADVFPAEYWKQCEPYWLLIDGVKAGCCAFDKHTLHAKGTLYVSTTGILPRFQRRGLGQLMKQWQIAYARRHGFTRIVITTRKSNAPMIALNRKFHFKTVRTIPRYYSDPTESALVMELLLSPPRRLPARPSAANTDRSTA
jgi:ribosomal protein S18 acetylase RimI-like enzyme